MRVLVVGSKFPPEYAGAGLRILRTYGRLRPAGLEVRVVTGSEEFADDAEYEIEGLPVSRIAAPLAREWDRGGRLAARLRYAVRAWSEAWAFWRRARAWRPDVVHVFGTCGITAAAIWWARRRNLPLLIELVTTGARPYQFLPGAAALRPFRLDERCAVVAISDALAQASAAQGLEQQTWARANPVDCARFRPATADDKAALRRQLTPFAPDDRVLCMVAKFMPQKNQAFLLEVLAALPPEWKLVLAGPLVGGGRLEQRDRDYVAAIRARAAAPYLAGRVHVVTDFVDAAAYMRCADVYALPNTREGLGTPLLEALCCGVPVVANAAEPPFRQWVRDGVDGHLRPLAAEAWAEAVRAAPTLAPAAHRRAAELAGTVSTAAIDADFLTLLRALAALPPDGRLRVSSVLAPNPDVRYSDAPAP